MFGDPSHQQGIDEFFDLSISFFGWSLQFLNLLDQNANPSVPDSTDHGNHEDQTAEGDEQRPQSELEPSAAFRVIFNHVLKRSLSPNASYKADNYESTANSHGHKGTNVCVGNTRQDVYPVSGDQYDDTSEVESPRRSFEKAPCCRLFARRGILGRLVWVFIRWRHVSIHSSELQYSILQFGSASWSFLTPLGVTCVSLR